MTVRTDLEEFDPEEDELLAKVPARYNHLIQAPKQKAYLDDGEWFE